MDIIEIENLKHRFADGTLGLDGINLKIRAGTFVVVAGPNGSGKSSLVNVAAYSCYEEFLRDPTRIMLIPCSFLCGCILLLGADTITRVMLPTEIPIGVLTALIGGPLFCYIFRKTQLQRWR